MAESASKQLLSALTEGREKGNKAASKKSGKSSAAKSVNQGRNQRGVASGGQTVTSTKRKCKSREKLDN